MKSLSGTDERNLRGPYNENYLIVRGTAMSPLTDGRFHYYSVTFCNTVSGSLTCSLQLS